MKSFYFLALFFLSISSTYGQALKLVVSNEPYEALEGGTDISADLDEPWDDSFFEFTLDEPFQLYGREITQLQVFDAIVLGITDSTDLGFFPLISDVIDIEALVPERNSPVLVATEGETGSRRITVEFPEIGFYENMENLEVITSINVKIVMDEAENSVSYHYGPSEGDPDQYFNLDGNSKTGVIAHYDQDTETITEVYLLNGDPANPTVGFYDTVIDDDLDNTEEYLSSYPAEGTKYTFSTIPASSTDFQAVDVTLYPNPSHGDIYIQDISGEAAYRLYNIDGRLIESGISHNGYLKTDKKGVFMLQVQVDDKWVNKNVVIK